MRKEYFILLPGWTRSVRTFRKFISAAPEFADVEFINYSNLIPEGDIAFFPDRLAAYIKQRKLIRVSLIGFSLGGALGFEFALKYPERINNLYLVNAAGIYGKESTFEILNNQTRNLLQRPVKVFRSIRNYAFSTNLLLNIKLGLYAHKIDLRNKTIPKNFPQTYILWGEKDLIHPLWQGQEFHKLIPGSKLVVLKGEAHDWMAYNPEKFWTNIKPLM